MQVYLIEDGIPFALDGEQNSRFACDRRKHHFFAVKFSDGEEALLFAWTPEVLIEYLYSRIGLPRHSDLNYDLKKGTLTVTSKRRHGFLKYALLDATDMRFVQEIIKFASESEFDSQVGTTRPTSGCEKQDKKAVALDPAERRFVTAFQLSDYAVTGTEAGSSRVTHFRSAWPSQQHVDDGSTPANDTPTEPSSSGDVGNSERTTESFDSPDDSVEAWSESYPESKEWMQDKPRKPNEDVPAVEGSVTTFESLLISTIKQGITSFTNIVVTPYLLFVYLVEVVGLIVASTIVAPLFYSWQGAKKIAQVKFVRKAASVSALVFSIVATASSLVFGIVAISFSEHPFRDAFAEFEVEEIEPHTLNGVEVQRATLKVDHSFIGDLFHENKTHVVYMLPTGELLDGEFEIVDISKIRSAITKRIMTPSDENGTQLTQTAPSRE